ncbi:MAG: serine protease [Rhodospirillaceae bacterium]|nr:serine protease [Rhodospirillaceae bacterium]
MAGTGSGFRVSASGHILTNAHVVRGCAEVRVPPASHARSRRVTVAARDDRADLALLKGRAGSPSAAFRQGRGIRPAASVIVAGYPLHGVLATRLNVSTGIVSALAGPGNNRRMIQISAPVQKGNSGGPVLDSAGNVVGVVVSKLDALRIARATGDIPQNVNFAVSAGTARAFLDSEGIAYATAPSDKPRAPEDVAAAARKFTVLVECWK